MVTSGIVDANFPVGVSSGIINIHHSVKVSSDVIVERLPIMVFHSNLSIVVSSHVRYA